MSRQVGDEESAAYTALTDGPSPGTPRKRVSVAVRVVAAAALSGLLIVGLLVGSFRNGGDAPGGGDDGFVCASLPVRGIPAAAMVAPISRGVSEGVSEKSNLRFGGTRANAKVESFPWSNNMLSWQRTAFHFQPEKNWMNDPNGPMFYKGWYHFFYQYNPKGAIWGNMVWGHAVSRDLIHWLHLPLAMVADKWYDAQGVFSGSATVLPDGRVIMLYTGSTETFAQVQNLAYPANLSDPLLIDWVKYPGNPILVPPPGIHMKDFRDPTTAWLTTEGKWRITIGSKVNKTGIAFVYETEDFINYELLPGKFHGVQGTGMWECVDFYPVSLSSDKGLDTSENGPGVKHVMKASMDDDRHDYYAIGVYDEKLSSWVPDNAYIDVGYGIRYDYGIFYASKSFYDPEKQRRILWGWIGESDSEVADVQKGWASVQGVPRTVILDKKTGTNLLQWPIEEVDDLRLGSNQFDNIVVKPSSVVPLDVGTASQVDIVAEFELDKAALAAVEGTDAEYECWSSGGAAGRGALGPFGLLVLAENCNTEQTPVYFYIAKGSNSSLKTYVCHDQSRSSLANDVVKNINGSFVPVLEGEKLSLRILVDHSIVETFAQGGRTSITSRVYPTRAIYGDAKILLFNNATSTPITASVKVWQMNSAFIRPYNPIQRSGIFLGPETESEPQPRNE